jgi:mycofactocin system glycosyltransferase
MSLPPRFIVRLNKRARVIDQGCALVGGSPTRYVRLSQASQNALNDREVDASTLEGSRLADKLLDLAMAEPVVELLPENTKDYTVVIPVKDRAESLRRLLTSIRESTVEGFPRIIVIDDASGEPDALDRVVEESAAEVVHLEENMGPAGARNVGLALVETDFVVFLDSDVVINHDTIPTLLKHFTDPKVGLAVPRITGLTPGTNWIGRYENARSSLDMGPISAAVKPRSPISWAPSAAMVGRVSALHDGFDSALRVGEDVDLIWRLSESGWRIRYEASAIAQHEHRKDFRQWFALKVSYGTGAVPLAKRHSQYIPPAVMTPWSVVMMASLIAQRRWSIPVAVAIAVGVTIQNGKLLSSSDKPYALGARLASQGIISAASQTFALMLKHWWPLTAVGCLLSRRIRNAALLAAVADVVVEYDKEPGELDVVSFGVAKRLDDIAYGAGVWLASFRARTLSALKPDWSSARK